ncbi:hypothetical protein SDC9_73484 [bioreactor metagenome]|uniref:Lipoprotein n=1 Tax=bioreactor metagenome TaxID=1076179 RepID=A0A644YF65_9ZZZZ
MKNVIFIFFISLVLCSCNKMSPIDFVKWVENEDNGLRKEKTIGECRFEIQYCPDEYISIKKGSKDIPFTNIDNRETDSGLCFIFRIERLSDNYDPSAFQLINEANFRLMSEADTVGSSMVLYENNFRLSSVESYTVLFDDIQAKNDFRFVYDGQVSMTGPVIFSFKKEDIKRIPEINN